MTPLEISNALASWLAALGTITASVVALWLARSSQRVKVNALVDMGMIVPDPSRRTYLTFIVTNTGERPVVINSIGWRVGTRRERRFCLTTNYGGTGDQLPKTLAHGEKAMFVAMDDSNIAEFAVDFVKDLSERSLRTLRGQFHTSVGHTETVHPADSVLQELRKHRSES